MTNWPIVNLMEVCDIEGGTQPPKETFRYEKSEGYVRMLQIQDFKSDQNPVFISEKGRMKLCQEEDILIARYGASIGRILRGKAGAYNVALVKTVPDDDRIERDFLYHLLNGASFQTFILNVGSRAAQAGFNKSDLERFQFLLPPLTEQRRIAVVLDRAEALRAKRRAALAQLDTLTQYIFLDLFGDPLKNTRKIKTAPLQDLCVRITDGTHQPPKWAASGHPFLFVSNIISGEINFDTQKFISDETHASLTRRCPIEVGDMLYSTVGSYGIPAKVRTPRKFAFQRHIAHLKPNPAMLDSEFLCAMLASPPLRRQADRAARGMAQKTVNLADIAKFVVFCPPLSDQRKFTRNVAALQKLRFAQGASLTELDALFAALQHRAFQGEL